MNNIDQNIKLRIDDYYSWLKDNTIIQSNSKTGWSMIATPYTAFHNDSVDIYVKEEDNYYLLSDWGETFDTLDMIGLTYSRGVKKEHIDYICRNYGIKISENNHIYIKSKKEDFSVSKHNLLTAILEISEMQYLVKDNVVSLFVDEVFDLLDDKKCIYTPEITIQGMTGLKYVFDIQRAGIKEELLVKTFNRLQQDNLERFLFSWQDVHNIRESQVRGKSVCGLAVINDIDFKPKKDLLGALESTGSRILLWSEKENKFDEAFDVA